jgi:Phage major capsid protein E
MMNLQATYAGVDPILTTLAQGFMLPATNIANFIAPVVDTPTRAGRILRFGKEQFAINDFRRAYGTNIPFVQSRYDSEPYALEQEVVAWELPEEVIENAGEGPAQVDLRAIETRNAMSRLMNAYEYTVSQAVTVTGSYNPYEPYNGTPGSQTGLGFTSWTNFKTAYGNAASTAAWSDSAADPILDVLSLKRAVANQIGIRPNSMVLGTAVFDELLTNQKILDRIKYTTADSIDTDMLARYFGLERGLRVAEGRYLAADGTLQPVFPADGILLFYSPNGPSDSVMPAGGANAATPAFAYTYQLTGTPAVRPEYYIRERRVVRAEITVERVVNLVGLGATGLIGSGAMISSILS